MNRAEGFDKPTVAQLEAEIGRWRYKRRYRAALWGTLGAILAAAAAVALAAARLPVLKISGDAMNPTLRSGEIVAVHRKESVRPGDIVAFYSGGKLLVKRVIGCAGDWVDIDDAGNVTVNGAPLDEPYLAEKALGACGIELPFRVPEGRWFVLGDDRATAADSRSPAVGCVAEEQILGRVALRVWPLERLNWFN